MIHGHELEWSALERTEVIVVDSMLVNQKYADLVQALKSDALETSRRIELGTLLGNPNLSRSSSEQSRWRNWLGLA
jgi:hypothetical protein